MPAILAAILEGLAVIGRAVWPYFLKIGAVLTIPQLWAIAKDWFLKFLSVATLREIVANLVASAGLVFWAAFLGVFFTYVTGSGLREAFSLNPFTGAPAAMLYLASYAFPFKFFFGISSAYIVWRFTFIHAAIVMNRLVKLCCGF